MVYAFKAIFELYLEVDGEYGVLANRIFENEIYELNR